MNAAIDVATPAPPPPVQVSGGTQYGIPIGASDVIRSGFTLWGSILGRLVLVSLIPFIPVFITGLVAAVAVPSLIVFGRAAGPAEGTVVVFMVIFLILLIGVAVVSSAAQAGMTLLLHDQARHQMLRRGSWQAFVEGVRYVPRIAGAVCLIFLAVVVTAGIVALVARVSPIAAVVLGMVTIVLYLYFLVRWINVVPAIVLDKKSVIDAFSYSARLTEGYGWTVFGGLVLFGLITVGIGLGSVIIGLIPILGGLINLGINILLSPLGVAVTFAIYAGLKDASGDPLAD
jgi:hypothetical protein